MGVAGVDDSAFVRSGEVFRNVEMLSESLPLGVFPHCRGLVRGTTGYCDNNFR